MTHLKRAGLALVVLLIAIFIVPRIVPVPDILANFGFHKVDKEADQALWASLPIQYANTSVCNNCHQSDYTAWAGAGHRSVSCEACHAAASTHISGGPPPQVDASPLLCAI
ncbi:MAG: hypothetical protein C4555_04870, partial [Dehalococcoidia bacterium]